ncbi:XkdQ/YqbQ family protein [Paenibacillus gansuensis]|uniref:YqbQ/XkdQ domain-containing protein n=1 Tax=Paenibacillus gansuensis TaxID=306542 RepID=A0ABW5PG88_9BACL
MFEVVIDNRNGTLWNVSELIPEASWKTKWIGAAGVFTCSLVRMPTFQKDSFEINTGDVIRVKVDGVKLFYGFVFTIEETEAREIKLTAYDQLRYMMEADTYVRAKITATQVIRENAAAAGLVIGYLEDTKHLIPKFSQDGQKRLDMVYKALDDTLLKLGDIFVLYDDFHSLTLRHVRDMRVNLILGDNSLVYGYSLSHDIDTDTYNRIKLVKDNKKTGKRDAYIYQDSSTIAKWGRLSYYQKVDDGLNDAQIEAMMKRFMALKNREQRKFKIDALGYVGVRAGTILQVTIKEQGIDQYYLVEECQHSWKGGEHTMSLNLRVYQP